MDLCVVLEKSTQLEESELFRTVSQPNRTSTDGHFAEGLDPRRPLRGSMDIQKGQLVISFPAASVCDLSPR
jgi:hypothetical protein